MCGFLRAPLNFRQYPVPPEGMIFIHNRKSVPLGVIFDEDTLRFLLSPVLKLRSHLDTVLTKPIHARHHHLRHSPSCS